MNILFKPFNVCTCTVSGNTKSFIINNFNYSPNFAWRKSWNMNLTAGQTYISSEFDNQCKIPSVKYQGVFQCNKKYI